MALLRSAALLIAVLGLGGCSWIGRLNPFAQHADENVQAQPADQAAKSTVVGDTASAVESSSGKSQAPAEGQRLSEQSSVPRPAAEASSEATTSSVEIRWQVPGESIEKYHLEYGSEVSNLDKHLEIPVTELEKVDDPVHGPLFRYVLTGIEPGTRVFFTVQAENQYGLSPKSPIQEIK